MVKPKAAAFSTVDSAELMAIMVAAYSSFASISVRVTETKEEAR
jgi:hypothetical protein